MHDGVELKLELSPDDVGRFRRHRVLRSLARGKPTTRRLRTAYFDAPDLALHNNGIALRVRSDGRRHIQSVKTTAPAAPGDGGADHETEVDGPAPELDRIKNRRLASFIARVKRSSTLTRVFETDVRRRVLPVRIGDAEIDVSLDVGDFTAGERSLPICEARLALRSGRPERLYDLALALHETLPFRLEHRSKTARGFHLMTGEAPAPMRARRVALDARMTVRQAFTLAARACLEQLRANERVVLESEDPEGVHQMRVALRRLRAHLGAFGKAIDPQAGCFLKDRCRWIHEALGPAREWDVLLIDALRSMELASPDDAAIGAMRAHAEAMRRDAYAAARRAIGESRYTGLVLQADAWLDNGRWAGQSDDGASAPADRPVGAVATGILDKRAGQLRRIVGEASGLSDRDLHVTRIRAKKLRYAAEALRGLYPDDAVDRYTVPLRAIQDELGKINDAATGRRLVATLVRSMSEAGDASTASRASAAVLGWFADRAEARLAVFRAAWCAHLSAEPFWTGD